jgi:hypothetical protein
LEVSKDDKDMATGLSSSDIIGVEPKTRVAETNGDHPANNHENGANHGSDSHINDTENHTPHATSSKYDIALNPDLAYMPRKLRVITIGAGYSGLMMAHKFQHRFPEMDKIVDHLIVEARDQIGGTWLVNTYPGVQCDVPSHIYVSTEDCWVASNIPC